MDTITGKIRFVTYTNGDFSIIKVKSDTPVTATGSHQISVKGNCLPTNTAVRYRFTGTLSDSKYGPTLDAVNVETVVENTKDSIVEYLSSGLFKGVGPTLAKRIYSTFKDTSIDIFENHTERLSEVKGIGPKLLTDITDAVRASKAAQLVIKTFTPYGLTSDQCVRLAGKYGSDATEKLLANPYLMMEPLRVPFEFCDGIAMQLGIPHHAPERIDAAIGCQFKDAMQSGDTGAEVQSFGRSLVRMLKNTLSASEVEAEIISRLTQKTMYSARIKLGDGTIKQYVFPTSMYKKESSLGENLCRIASSPVPADKTTEKTILSLEQKLKITLDPTQREAAVAPFSHPLTVITGGPGTGKTTIEKIIVRHYEETRSPNKCVLLAPTGRAARKLAEYTGHSASTIHSLLNIYDEDKGADGDIVIENAMVIIDEFSMADTAISEILFSCMGRGTQVVLVGDIDQLPSVGPGAVLRDVINSGIAKVIRLNKIFRADADSNIYQNTKRINEGDSHLTEGSDFRIHKTTDMEESRKLMTDLYLAQVEKYGVENTMLLLPYRKNLGGVTEMNNYLQSIINPPAQGKFEYRFGDIVFREGDFCMHVRKNTPDASNGDLGMITKVLTDGKTVEISVLINNKTIVYKKDNLDCLTLAYAMTIHKSQGSEAKAVITCVTKDYPMMLYRSIPYVAVSRGKLEVDLICDDSFDSAVKTVKSNNRITLLPHFLKLYSGQFVPA